MNPIIRATLWSGAVVAHLIGTCVLSYWLGTKVGEAVLEVIEK